MDSVDIIYSYLTTLKSSWDELLFFILQLLRELDQDDMMFYSKLIPLWHTVYLSKKSLIPQTITSSYAGVWTSLVYCIKVHQCYSHEHLSASSQVMGATFRSTSWATVSILILPRFFVSGSPWELSRSPFSRNDEMNRERERETKKMISNYHLKIIIELATHSKGHFRHETESLRPLQFKNFHCGERRSWFKFASHYAWGTNWVCECKMDVEPTWHQMGHVSWSLGLCSKTTSWK